MAGRSAHATTVLVLEQLSGLVARERRVEAENFAAAEDLPAGLAGARFDRPAEKAAWRD
jgi:hypothetical protein